MPTLMIRTGAAILATSFAAFLLPAAASAGDFREWLKTDPVFRQAAIGLVRERLCREYRPPGAYASCASAGRILGDELDFAGRLSREEKGRLATALSLPAEEAAEATVTAFHVGRLRALLEAPATDGYLADLAFKHRYDRPNFNLWHESERLSARPADALERVAVLFQDLSGAREHLLWAIARDVGGPTRDRLASTLEPLIAELRIGFTDLAPGARPLARYYPEAVVRASLDDLSPGAYHFYSAAYWAYRMRAAGASEADAVLHAFGIHLAYEVKDLSAGVWPIVGPLPRGVDSEYKARDLATAFLGASFGADLFAGRPIRTHAALRERFVRDLPRTMRELFPLPAGAPSSRWPSVISR